MLVFAYSAFGQGPPQGPPPPPMPEGPPSMQPQGVGGPKILKPSSQALRISMKDALQRALQNHTTLKLANNNLERREVEITARWAALLPKIRLGSVYTRNFPAVKKSLSGSNESQIELNQHVASLLRKNGELGAADRLERRAASMVRADPRGKLVISPKHLFESKLSIEIPLFNGPDIARLMASNEAASLQAARVREEEALTIYKTAKTYYQALHLQNILLLREQAEIAAEERHVIATEQHRRGRLLEKDFKEAKANYFQKQAERQGSVLDYRAAIGDLGIIIGVHEEFAIEDSDIFIFENLNASPEKLIELAMLNRPDLKAEQLALKVADHERLSNFLQFLPTLTLQGDAKYTSNNKSMLGENFTYAISVNAGVSIFDGGASIAELRDTSLKKRESEIKIRQLTVDIEATIRGRKERMLQLAASEKAYELKAEAAKLSLDVAVTHYSKGLIKHQELLDISDRKLDTDIAYKRVQFDIQEEKLALIYEAGLLTPQFVR